VVVSLILDALSRAEREKRTTEQGVPDILSSPATAERPSRRAGAVALAGGVILLLLALATVWWVSRDESVVVGSPAVIADADADPVADRETVNAAAAMAVTEQTSDHTTAVAPRVDMTSAASVRQEQNSGDQRSAIDALYSSAENSDDALAPMATVETPVDIAQVLRSVRREQGNGALSEHPVAVLDSLSKQYRDRVPTLMYLRHDFASGSGSSTVVINGETLRAGQRTSAVEVVEILADSVILSFDSKEFRLRALNSWVNL
jgi:general secretion pathway protein B